MTDFDQREGILLELDQKTLVPSVPLKWEIDDDFYQISENTFRTFSIGEKILREKVRRFKKFVKDEPFQQYLPYSIIPTALCRTSPFWVMNRNDPEYTQRPYLRDHLVTKTSWGSLTVSGPKLSILDEDVLLGVLYFINLTNRDKESKRLRVPRNTYTGRVRAILKVMGIKNPSTKDYERFRNSLRMIYENSFVYQETRGPNAGTLLFRVFDVLYYERPKDSKKQEGVTFLHISLNKQFLELCGGTLAGTFLVMAERSKLKRQTSKALYRFLRSQKPGVLRLHLNTLKDVLNLNPDLSPRATKRELNRAIKEMIKNDLLRSGSGFTRANNCILVKRGAKLPEEEKTRREIGRQTKQLIGQLAQAKTSVANGDHENRVRIQARLFPQALEGSKNTGRPAEEILDELCRKYFPEVFSK